MTTDKDGSPCTASSHYFELPYCAECAHQLTTLNKHVWVKFAATKQDWLLMMELLPTIPVWIPMNKAWQGTYSWIACVCYHCQKNCHQNLKTSIEDSALEPTGQDPAASATTRVILHALANHLFTNMCALEEVGVL